MAKQARKDKVGIPTVVLPASRTLPLTLLTLPSRIRPLKTRRKEVIKIPGKRKVAAPRFSSMMSHRCLARCMCCVHSAQWLSGHPYCVRPPSCTETQAQAQAQAQGRGYGGPPHPHSTIHPTTCPGEVPPCTVGVAYPPFARGRWTRRRRPPRTTNPRRKPNGPKWRWSAPTN
jgi:hypothetical protein